MTCYIKKTCSFVSSVASCLTLRHWGMIFFAISAAVIAAVLISQYGFGLMPCELCLIQRIPFYVALGASFMMIVTASAPRWAYVFLAILVLCFISSTALATFHLGVEYKWWTYNSGCTAGIFGQGGSTADILAALKAAPVVKCDERVIFLFGMTMAFYNVLTSAFLTVLALFATWNMRGALCGRGAVMQNVCGHSCGCKK